MLAALTKTDELQVTEPEAEALAKAIAEVAKHYEAVPGMSEKAAAWANLGLAAGMMYGPRFMAYRMRTATDARQRAAMPSVVL